MNAPFRNRNSNRQIIPTMKTKTKTSTRSASNAHKGQTTADTNNLKEFEVYIFRAQHGHGRIVVEAATLEEAQKMANNIRPDEIEDWDIYDAQVYVDSVEPVDKGQEYE